jgi:hypothetical protein
MPERSTDVRQAHGLRDLKMLSIFRSGFVDGAMSCMLVAKSEHRVHCGRGEGSNLPLNEFGSLERMELADTIYPGDRFMSRCC